MTIYIDIIFNTIRTNEAILLNIYRLSYFAIIYPIIPFSYDAFYPSR